MTEIRESHELFNKHVEHIFFRNEADTVDCWGYTNSEEANPPIRDFKGWMYVTTGDEKPWLVIYGPNGFGISLNPELATFWLDKIKKFYDSSEQKEINK